MESKSSTAATDNRVTAVSVTLRFPALLGYRSLAIDLVSTFAQHVPCADRDFRNEVVTAFGEAFNNIVIHGYRGRTDGMLDVEAELTGQQITLRLSDTGREIDFTDVKPPDLTTMPESGMGIFMIHALVDEVSYCGGSPNVLTLIKRITSSEDDR